MNTKTARTYIASFLLVGILIAPLPSHASRVTHIIIGAVTGTGIASLVGVGLGGIMSGVGIYYLDHSRKVQDIKEKLREDNLGKSLLGGGLSTMIGNAILSGLLFFTAGVLRRQQNQGNRLVTQA